MPTTAAKKTGVKTKSGEKAVSKAGPVKEKKAAVKPAGTTAKAHKARSESKSKPAEATKPEPSAETPSAPVRKPSQAIPSSPALSKSAFLAETPVAPVATPFSTPSTPSTSSGQASSGQAAQDESVVSGNVVHMKMPIVVKDLATTLKLKPFQVISDLMQQNILASINQTIDEEIARVICQKHGFVLETEKRERHHTHGTGATVEESRSSGTVKPEAEPVKAKNLQPRAPVVTIMGHVDHGKTSLLDVIRHANVAAGEAGGITQHIGAYTITVKHGGKDHPITFLDTPGHEAFSAMRARGANVTDLVILVIAADDGLMPQTIEAISHAKAAKVPIIVAINKIDLPGLEANKTKLKKQLQEKGLAPEDWGGQTICCEVSATKKTGVDHLLEMILLQAELLELKADPTVPPRGNVVETQMEQGRGPTATVLIKEGTLKRGMTFIVGPYWGKVKALLNEKGQILNQALPSQAVKIVGLPAVPQAGVEFRVVEDETEAREHSERELAKLRTGKLEAPTKVTLENLFHTLAEGQKKNLRVILKTDVQGSAEAIADSLTKIPGDKVRLELIHVAVGPISESDVLLASASNAVIIGFGSKVDPGAAEMAKREGVQIKLYRIIYELIDQVKEAMAGLLDPEIRTKVLGQVEIKQIFNVSKGKVAGCIVLSGLIVRNGKVRLLRNKNILWEGQLTTLKRFQDDVAEVRTGLECGIRLGNYTEFEVGDIIEAFETEKISQKL